MDDGTFQLQTLRRLRQISSRFAHNSARQYHAVPGWARGIRPLLNRIAKILHEKIRLKKFTYKGVQIFLRARCSLICIRPLLGSCKLQHQFGLNWIHALHAVDGLLDDLDMIADGRRRGVEASPPGSILHQRTVGERRHCKRGMRSGNGRRHPLKLRNLGAKVAVVELFLGDVVRVSLAALHVELLVNSIPVSLGTQDKASRQSNQGIAISHCHWSEAQKENRVRITYTHIHTHTHTYIYICATIYVSIYAYNCIYIHVPSPFMCPRLLPESLATSSCPYKPIQSPLAFMVISNIKITNMLFYASSIISMVVWLLHFPTTLLPSPFPSYCGCKHRSGCFSHTKPVNALYLRDSYYVFFWVHYSCMARMVNDTFSNFCWSRYS